MPSESGRTLRERSVESLERAHDTYDRVESRVRTYTPYIVRIAEVVLAVVLLAVLAHWLYWVYIAGV